MKQTVIIFLLIVFSATVASAYPAGDINEDWKVDLVDLQLLISDWLTKPDCYGVSECTDLSGDINVNLIDVALIAEKWMTDTMPTLVINEFMASNNTTMQDPDEAGEYPDWIEIYNYGTDAIKMEGMQLNDSSNTYTIGAGVTINVGEHKIFYADDDDEQGPLHTNFKLRASGDEIYLYRQDGILIDSITYSQGQLADHSYGRYPDNTNDWYAMDSPTPSTANTTGMAGKVWFSRLSGPFISTFQLELSTESPTAQIWYTINDQIPKSNPTADPNSTLYTGPITITDTSPKRIRARAFDSPLAPGPLQSHYYTPIASDIQDFSSNLPIVILDTYGVNITEDYISEWDPPSSVTTFSAISSTFIDVNKDSGLAAMADVPDYAGRTGMRLRGQSTLGWPKKQFALELWGDDDEDIKKSLLSMPAESDWVLNAPYSDKTFIRNILVFKWSNEMGKGFAASGTKLVEVFLNDDNGPCTYDDYNGVYVLIERPKVSSNRLDIGSLDPSDTTEPDITGGYALRVDKINDGDSHPSFQTSANYVGDIQYFDPEEISPIQENWIKGWFDTFETDLFATDFNNPLAGYAQHIDIDSFIENDLIGELFRGVDTFLLSTYFYKKRNGKLHFGPHWDYNFSSGNSSGGVYPVDYSKATTLEGWSNGKSAIWAKALFFENSGGIVLDRSDLGIYSWHTRLLQDPDYMLKTADKWFDSREDTLSDSQVSADIDYYYDLLDHDGAVNTGSTAADRNFTRWPILDVEGPANYYYGGNPDQNGGILHTYHMETEWFKNWFNGQGIPAAGESYSEYAQYSDRLGNLDLLWLADRNIAAPPTFLIDGNPSNTGATVAPGSTLTMTGSAGTIYYTTDGTDPREWNQSDLAGGVTPFNRTLVAEDAAKKVHVPSGAVNNNWKGGDSFDDSSWNDYSFVSGKSGGVGYEANSGYEEYISYNVKSLMYDTFHPTCYIRTSFSVDAGDLADMNYMTLRVRHDEAFVAYINGAEVARSTLVPTSLDWDSSATGVSAETVAFTDYTITAHIGLLNSGSGNILAVHGLNDINNSSDLLISYELEAGAATTSIIPGGAISASAIQFISSSGVSESQDFELGMGSWVNVSSVDTDDWSRDSGGTLSSNTGPSAGASGSTWCMYMETTETTNGAGANDDGDSAILEGPEVSGTNMQLSFYYHMCGVNIGTLNVDVYSGGSWINGIWNISGEQHTSEGDAYTNATVDLSGYSSPLKVRFRGVAVGGHQGDMAIDDIEITGDAGDDVVLDKSVLVKARIKNGTNWSALNEAAFSIDNVAPSLRITEIMYHPEDPNDEYIELQNIGGDDIDIALCKLTKGVDFTFPSIVLASGEYVVVARNVAEFNAKYSFAGNLAGEYTNDKLDNGGENISLEDAAGNIIQEFEYEDGWFPVTDGKGFSLNIIDPADTNLDNWNKRLNWQASNVKDGTPGASHAANEIANGAIVINEVLTHTDDLVYGDWIELHNTTASSVNIGNWYLSDDIDDLKKYKIAPGTTITASGYKVFTSVSNFRNPSDDGCDVTFGLSEHGEAVYLTSGNGSDISGGFSSVKDFGAADNGKTFGRHTKSAAADYNVDFVQMTSPTRGYDNATTPYVPGVVITEIMYNAKDVPDMLGEYIELYNNSGHMVYLYDIANPSNTWKFTKGIDFEFPAGVSMTNGERILVSRANPAAFKAANGLSGVTVYGPFANYTELENDGEKIELSMPGTPEPGSGFVPYIRVEQVNYSDGAPPLGNDPWPTGADARGDSLQRDSVSSYSNDVDNWSATEPTPGS